MILYGQGCTLYSTETHSFAMIYADPELEILVERTISEPNFLGVNSESRRSCTSVYWL